MTKKEYFEKNKWKTIFHKCNFCYNKKNPLNTTWTIETQEVISLDNEKYTICKKCFLKNEIGGEND